MTLGHYIAEEIGTDWAQGFISRREALRRLSLLGIAGAAATSLLAACARQAGPDRGRRPAGSPPPASPTGAPTEGITFPGPAGMLQGAWAAPASPRGAVLVIHENQGLDDHHRSVAGRLARDGYAALAIDLLSREGGTGSFRDSGEATAALARAEPERFIADLRAGIDEIGRRAASLRVGAVGFCFGGGLVWRLLAAGEPRVAAAVPFYGPAPAGADFSRSKAAVLAIYGELDERVNATRDAVVSALARAGLEHRVVTFPGADHAFFNDARPRYHPESAARAYREMLAWFGRHLAGGA